MSGDFDRDGYPEVVFSFIDQHDVLRAYMWDLSIQSSLVWGAAAKQSQADLQACGCYDTQTIIRQLFDQALPVVLPEPVSYPIYQSLQQPAGGTNTTVRVDSPGYSYSLAAGDVGRVGFANVRCTLPSSFDLLAALPLLVSSFCDDAFAFFYSW